MHTHTKLYYLMGGCLQVLVMWWQNGPPCLYLQRLIIISRVTARQTYHIFINKCHNLAYFQSTINSCCWLYEYLLFRIQFLVKFTEGVWYVYYVNLNICISRFWCNEGTSYISCNTAHFWQRPNWTFQCCRFCWKFLIKKQLQTSKRITIYGKKQLGLGLYYKYSQ